MRPRLLLPVVLALSLVVAACGGSDDATDDGSSGTAADATTTAPDGDAASSDGSSRSDGPDSSDAGTRGEDAPALDACALADPAQVQALGVTAEGAVEDRPGGEGITWVTCRWGNLTDETGVVYVQVLTEGADAVVNPLDILLSTAGGDDAAPVDVGTDGKLYEFALIAGGGGVGRTIAFTADGNRTVAVSRTGADVDVAALTALAQGVATNL